MTKPRGPMTGEALDAWKHRLSIAAKRNAILRQSSMLRYGYPLSQLRLLRDLIDEAKRARGNTFTHRGVDYVIRRKLLFDAVETTEGSHVVSLGGELFRV